MPRSIAIFLTTAMLSAVTDLSGAEFLVIGTDMGITRLSADGRVSVGQTPLAIQEGSQALIWSRELGIQTLGVLPNADMSRARDVSADGSVVVGYNKSAIGEGQFGTGWDEPFIWTNENGMVGLGHLPGFENKNIWDWMNVSDDGSTVVGTFMDHAQNKESAFRWTKEDGLVALMPPGKDLSSANAVSADGSVIVGHASTLAQAAAGREDAFIWDQDNGYQKLEPKPRGWIRTYPWLVSADGKVVFGEDFTNDPLGRSFIWTAEQGMQKLPGESMRIDHFRDLTPDGSIVVGSAMEQDGSGPTWAFVWDEHNGTRDLRDVLVSEHGFAAESLPTLSLATGISADAMAIVGSSEQPETRWAIYLDKPLVSPRGDFDRDHYRTAADIDLLSRAVVTGNPDAVFDVNSDGMTDEADRVYWVHKLANTYFGDANLDGEFNSSDFTRVFLAGEYEDAIDDNSGWAEGDWNGDADFTSSDMITAFLDGGYEQGPRGAVRAVPEPSTGWMVLMGALFLVIPELCERRPLRA